MTGQNKYVCAVFSRYIVVDKKNELHDLLVRTPSGPLTNAVRKRFVRLWIPIHHTTTKEQLCDYILSEVKSFVPFMQATYGRHRLKIYRRFVRLVNQHCIYLDDLTQFLCRK